MKNVVAPDTVQYLFFAANMPHGVRCTLVKKAFPKDFSLSWFQERSGNFSFAWLLFLYANLINSFFWSFN